MGCGHLNGKQVLILLLIGSRSKKCIVLLGDLVCIVQTQMAVTLLHNVVYGATVVHTCAAEVAYCGSSYPYPPCPFSLLSLSSFLKRQDFPIRHTGTDDSERLSFFVLSLLLPVSSRLPMLASTG